MPAYIISYSLIAPGYDHDLKKQVTDSHDNSFLVSQNPDYKKFFNPMAIRRFSRILKNGSYAAMDALKNANVDVPDAILAGTGYGCFEDTINFLEILNENHGSQLNPTPFIQSTHNSISSLIALQLKCHGYNASYSHGSLSFENALTDSMLLLDENPEMNVLCGAADEMNDSLFHSLESTYTLMDGIKWGEVTAMFVLTSHNNGDCLCRISDMVFSNDVSDNHSVLHAFLKKNKLSMNDIDLIFSPDELNLSVKKPDIINWKKFIGESMTSVSAAMALATEAISNEPHIKNVLIMNRYLNSSSSFILLQSC